MKRIVEPEFLDSISPDDPRSKRLRRDLAHLNFWMRNRQAMTTALKNHFNGHRIPQRIVELGAGDGRLLLHLAGSSKWQNVNVTLLDRRNAATPQTLRQFTRLCWVAETLTADVFDWPGTAVADAVVTNLFLHHFEDERLSQLLLKISGRTNYFAAIEPHRFPSASFFKPLFFALGCHAITRHDAVTSIRAGFRENEISRLWPDKQNWKLTERRSGLFAHMFIAERMS